MLNKTVHNRPVTKSLKYKILLPLIALGVVFAMVLILTAQFRFQQLLVEKLAVRAELLANTVNYAAEGLSRAGELQRIVTTLGAEREVNLILVVAATEPARILATNKNVFLGKSLNNLDNAEIERSIQNTLQSQVIYQHFDQQSASYNIVTPLLLSQSAGMLSDMTVQAVVFVQLDSQPTQSAVLKTVMQFTAVFLSLVVILVAYSYWLLKHYVINPVTAITRQVSNNQEIKTLKGNLTHYDEIGLLSDTLKDALNQAESAYQSLEIQQKERNQLLKIIDEAPDFIGMSDMQANLKYLNEAARKMVGLSDDVDISKLKINDMHPEWATNLILQEGIPAILKHGFWKSEHAVLKSVGHFEIPVSQVLTLHRDENGEPILISTIMRDITERKKNQKRLLESEFRWKFAVEGSGDGLWDWDIKNSTVFFSHRWKEMLGFNDDEIGNGLDEWEKRIHPDEKIHVFQVVKDYLDGKTNSYICEHRVSCKDGSYKWILDRGIVVDRDSEGKPLRLIGTHTDITERKNLETELIRSNAELEQFAYAVSHDMRQPLRMVTSYLTLIEKALKTQLDDDTRQFLTFAVDGATRMDSMILSLLDYSRVGRGNETFSVISTRAAVDEALSFLKPVLESCEGTVEVSGDWVDVVANHDELTRLFQNLIGNALKYHDENKLPFVHVLASVTSNTFRVEVRDNGIGIAANQIDRLFKVFSRLQARTRFEGSGVGLALCRKIIEHHGGEIGVQSEGEGLGCVFWFELPFDNKKQNLGNAK